MRRGKIVCTLGPACSDYDTLRAMASAGMDVARFNFSHGSYETHALNLEQVRRVEQEMGRPLATLLDTKGPEIRTGTLKERAPVTLMEGKTLVLTTREEEGDAARVSVSYDRLSQEISPGMDVFIDDGTLHLRVEQVEGGPGSQHAAAHPLPASEGLRDSVNASR